MSAFCLLLILMLFLCCICNRSCVSVAEGIIAVALVVLDHVFDLTIRLWSICVWSRLFCGNAVCYKSIWFIVIMLKCDLVTWHSFYDVPGSFPHSLSNCFSQKWPAICVWCMTWIFFCTSNINALIFVLKWLFTQFHSSWG